MKKIDGEKYVNRSDYNKAMAKVLAGVSDRFKDMSDDPTMALLVSMLITGELLDLGYTLFGDKE